MFRSLVYLLTPCLLLACNSAAVQQCQQEMTLAENSLQNLKEERLENVEAALLAVDTAWAACSAAKRSAELRELEQAKEKLSAQLKNLRATAPAEAPEPQ